MKKGTPHSDEYTLDKDACPQGKQRSHSPRGQLGNFSIESSPEILHKELSYLTGPWGQAGRDTQNTEHAILPLAGGNMATSHASRP